MREIAEVIGGLQDGALPEAGVRAVLEAKLDDVDARIADLTTLRALLQVRLDDVCALGVGEPSPGRAVDPATPKPK